MKKIGYGLIAASVVGVAYAFLMPKGDYGTTEYRSKQPLGFKILIASVIIGSAGYIMVKQK